MANHFSVKKKKKEKGGIDKEGERRTSLPPFSLFNLGYQETTLPFLLDEKKKKGGGGLMNFKLLHAL